MDGKEQVPSFSSRFASLLRKGGNRAEMGFVESQMQHHKAEERRVGLGLKDNNLIL